MSLEFTAASSDLLRLLGRVVSIANERSPIPSLGCVLLFAENGRLRVSASDLYNTMSGSIDVDIKHVGGIAVGARDFFDRVKAMPSGPVAIRVDDKSVVHLKGSTGNRKYQVRGLPAADYPAVPVLPSQGAAHFELATEVLASLFDRAHFSISTDETQPAIASLLLDWVGDELRAVSTDRHRLSRVHATVSPREKMLQMLLSAKSVKELRKHCGDVFTDRPATVKVTLDGSTAFFEGGGMVFSTKLVEAQFPPYDLILKKEPPSTTVRVGKSTLADALRAMLLTSSLESDVRISVGDSSILLDSKSEKGEGSDELPADITNGKKQVVRMSAKYLLDAIGAVAGDSVVLGFDFGWADPIRVFPDAKEETYLGLVMPRVD